jgi:hypothetical protein
MNDFNKPSAIQVEAAVEVGVEVVVEAGVEEVVEEVVAEHQQRLPHPNNRFP